MRLRLLGEPSVEVDGVVVDLGTPKQQVVLVALVLAAGQPVPFSALIERVWADDPPARCRNLLATYASRLRRCLAASATISHRSGTYVLRCDPATVDLFRFRREVAEARAAVGRDDRAALHRYERGLAEWRGSALAGLPGKWVDDVSGELAREYRDAQAGRVDVLLRLGRYDEAAEAAHRLMADSPLDERFAAQLIESLGRTGRTAEAIETYHTMRDRLAEQLGVDPSAEVQHSYLRLLHQTPATGTAATPAEPAPPAQLPTDVAGFIGRREELARLDTMLGPLGGARTSTPVAVLSGTAGVGKTALALHWGHRVAVRFPDGQLYIDLRGFGPDEPVDPADALGRLLDGLGVAGQPRPTTRDELAARYRTEVARRRLLIVLDNASSAEQVRPLLPGTGSCTVVVTSRDRLAGLVAVDGALRIDLDVLSPAEAVAVLGALVGERVRADPGAAAGLAEQCARLPLALRITAELAVCRPATSLAQLVAELSDQQRRLELLDAGGDPRASVAGVFSWSLRHLPESTAHAFRLLGAHPGPDLDPYAVAALADISLEPARRHLEGLDRAHLAHRTASGRYALHDLLRAYASQLFVTHDTDDQRQAAQTRMFDYYLGTAAAAMDRLFPTETRRRPRVPRPTTPAPDFAERDDALGWLDQHRSTLVAVAARAADRGWPAHAIGLSTTLVRYLDGGHNIEALAIHGSALRAARLTGDRSGQAEALVGVGLAHFRRARYAPAAEHYQQALALLGEVDDRIGQARVLNNLGLVEQVRGRLKRATEHHRRALLHYRQAGEPLGEASSLSNLGLVAQRSGQHREAADLFGQALDLYRQVGDRVGEAIALDNLGTALTKLGQPHRAADHHRQVLDICREIGNLDGQAWAHNGLGEAAHAAGDDADALTHHAAALTAAVAVGGRDQQARANDGLGQAHHARGNRIHARTHYQRALSIYQDLGLPEADEVRARLSALDNGTAANPR